MQNFAQMLPFALIIASFLIAATISERSLREVDDSTQGRLMSGLATFRRIHLIGMPVILLIGYFFSFAFWFVLSGYFGISAFLVAKRLGDLGLPKQLRRSQIYSVVTIFVGINLAWACAHFVL